MASISVTPLAPEMSITGSGVSCTAANREKTSVDLGPVEPHPRGGPGPLAGAAAPRARCSGSDRASCSFGLGAPSQRPGEGMRENGDIADAAGHRQSHGRHDAVGDVGKAAVDQTAVPARPAPARGRCATVSTAWNTAVALNPPSATRRVQALPPPEITEAVCSDAACTMTAGAQLASSSATASVVGEIDLVGVDRDRAREHVGAGPRRRPDPGEAKGVAAGDRDPRRLRRGGCEIAGDALGEAAGPENQDVARAPSCALPLPWRPCPRAVISIHA